jgi:hypothetical protein
MRVGVGSHFGEESIYGLGQDEVQKYAAFTAVINVRDASGRPVNNARITLVNKSSMTPFDQRVTDTNGNAKITAQIPDPPGMVNLAYRVDKADPTGMVAPTVFDVIPGHGEEPQGLTVDVKGGAPGGSRSNVPIPAIVGGVVVLGILGFLFFKK